MKLPTVASLAACGVGSLLVAFGVLGLPQSALAQTSLGTWKLNLATSTYSPGPPPKSLTRTSVASSVGVKTTFEGVAGDGSRISYSVTANYDGKDYPMTGVGTTNGADTIAMRRIDTYTVETIAKRAGKVVNTTRQVISKNGEVLTNTSKGTNQSGQPTRSVAVFDKQRGWSGPEKLNQGAARITRPSVRRATPAAQASPV